MDSSATGTPVPIWRRVAPVAIVGFAYALLALLHDVSVHDLTATMFVMVALQIIPGALIALSVLGQMSWPLILAIGSGIGLSSFVLLFIACGLTGGPQWFPITVPVWAALCAVVWFARGRPLPSAAPLHVTWSIAGLSSLTMVLVAATNFPFHPLPEHIDAAGATYYFDLPWHMGIAGMLKTHWPPANPSAAGLVLHYHIGSHALFAGLSMLSDASIPTLMLCLAPLMLAAQITLQIYCLGWRLVSPAVGALSVILVLYAGGADLLVAQPSPYFFSNIAFLNVYLSHIYVSPSFVLATILLISGMSLFVVIEQRKLGLANQTAAYVLIGIVLLGTAISKGGTVLTFGLGALLAFPVIGLLTGQWRTGLLIVGALAFVAQLSVSPIAVPPISSAVQFKFGKFLLSVPAFQPLSDFAKSHPHLFRMFATPLWLAAYAPSVFLGVIGGLALARRRFIEQHALLLTTGLVGVGAVLTLYQGSSGQIYIFQGAYPAIAVVASVGLILVWSRSGWVGRGAIVAILALSIGSRSLDLHPAYRKLEGAQLQSQERLTPGIVEALAWLRANTAPGEPFGINQQMIRRPDRGDIEQIRNSDYAGLAERPPVAGGIDYAGWDTKSKKKRRPGVFGRSLEELSALQKQVYLKKSVDAAAKLHQYTGVRYFFLDKRAQHDHEIFRVAELPVRFENADAAILEFAKAPPHGP